MKTRILALLLTLFCWLDAGAAVTLGNQTSFYPRMLRLASNGHLLASFDYGTTQSTIWDSSNNGASWTQIGTLSLSDPGHCCSGLYEMPQAVGGTPKGALLWSTSTTNGGTHTIKLYRSTDQGHSWSLLSTPVTGGTGVWEAEFAVDSSGRLVMYYSSEEYKGSGYNQLIAHRISNDGGVSWSGDTIDVGISDGNVQRPGMPLVARLPNGSYVMTYEVCGASNCEAFIRSSSDGVNWGTPSNLGTRIESSSGNHFTQTPTVRWYNDGSTNGRLLVTAMVLRRNADNSIAAGNGQTFMYNTNNGNGVWTEGATPQKAATTGGSDVCNGYTSQLLPSTDGSQLYELVNVGCSIKFASGPMDNPVASGVYTVISKNSGLALDVNACSTAAGANVQQWTPNGANCQRWNVQNNGNGDYVLTAMQSGLALDVDACATANGANVQQWTPNGAACQAWRPEPVGDGYFRFVSKNSGLVLDVNACSVDAGANVQQWQWLGGDCQRWKLQPSP
ncbi:RICIN domain-containing protein [Duganella violaceipulchra]|uniref:RICIN domain-containing protein n=1 Tax=Duganella violaceipulchra TaxID=2849652 RepID=A0AA41L1V1_9BURK|nr:RICIN domain-containing protein [Duganella violaceicalia]MBV6319404.1 RICIN domain-containing protein [Duganella violaceicalia]MCP2006785.1 hypothetical protein [Duganella violaceicalia]